MSAPRRILLLGGTSESAPLAGALLAAGHSVLVSQATDAPLDLPEHPRLRRRRGRLDVDGLADLIRAEAIGAVVDAGHPYAVELHRCAQAACTATGVPVLRFARPTAPLPAWVEVCADHVAAAESACTAGASVLLTTGSRHLAPYANIAKRTGAILWARVLDDPASFAACAAAGIPPERIHAGRGPFSPAETLALLQRSGATVLVSKDSGEAGGLEAKLSAARVAGVRMLCVARPSEPYYAVHDPATLLAHLENLP